MIELKQYISDTVGGLRHSGIDMIFERASRMDDVVVLAMGQPDFNTPDNVSKAGIRAIEEHHTRYTDDLGVKLLREETSQYLEERYGLKYNPDNEIIILAGVSSAVDTALRTLVNPGDEVIVQQPSYSSYVPCVQLAGGIPVIADTYEEDGFKLKAQRLRSLITPRTKALIISYPNNPTGAVMNREDLMPIRDVVEETGILVISDEIYSEMVYDGEFISFASLNGMKERVITANGVSKTYSMPGWRVGYACAPRKMVDAMLKVHQYTVMNVPSISQYAAAEAMRNSYGYVREIHEIYDSRRRYVVKRLEKMGVRCFEPKGAFYVFPSIEGTGLDSETFCRRLLDKARVAVVPGSEFGRCGEGYIRIAYTMVMEELEKGMDRIEGFISSL